MDEFEELGGEFPDIHSLFMFYNDLYFGGVLGNTTVEWSSKRMTSCGGTCRYHPLMGCQIKLSEPLLKFRPVRDLKMVLLHEMIHAHNMTLKIRDPDPGGHGPPFVELMNKINNSTVPDMQRPAGGYKITTTHSMIDEVMNYRIHWWECERCKKVIKRSMNRPPQEADCIGSRTGSRGANCRDPNCGYHSHIRTCGGTFMKIREPEPKPNPARKRASPTKQRPPLPPGQQRIDGLGGGGGTGASGSGRALKRPAEGAPLQASDRKPQGGDDGGSRGGAGARTPAQPQPRQHSQQQQQPHHQPRSLESFWRRGQAEESSSAAGGPGRALGGGTLGGSGPGPSSRLPASQDASSTGPPRERAGPRLGQTGPAQPTTTQPPGCSGPEAASQHRQQQEQQPTARGRSPALAAAANSNSNPNPPVPLTWGPTADAPSLARLRDASAPPAGAPPSPAGAGRAARPLGPQTASEVRLEPLAPGSHQPGAGGGQAGGKGDGGGGELGSDVGTKEPSAEELRRRCAEAALARLQRGVGSTFPTRNAPQRAAKDGSQPEQRRQGQEQQAQQGRGRCQQGQQAQRQRQWETEPSASQEMVAAGKGVWPSATAAGLAGVSGHQGQAVGLGGSGGSPNSTKTLREIMDAIMDSDEECDNWAAGAGQRSEGACTASNAGQTWGAAPVDVASKSFACAQAVPIPAAGAGPTRLTSASDADMQQRFAPLPVVPAGQVVARESVKGVEVIDLLDDDSEVE